MNALAVWLLVASFLQPVVPHKCVTVVINGCAIGARSVGFAPAGTTLCAEVKVDPHEAHRWLEVSWDQTEEDAELLDPTVGPIGFTAQGLDGAEEKRLVRAPGFRMDDLGRGTYTVTVVVCTRSPNGPTARCTGIHGTASARVTLR